MNKDSRQMFEFAFLGMDGSGKTTIARAVEQALNRVGVSARCLSWRSTVGTSAAEISRPIMELHSAVHRIIWRPPHAQKSRDAQDSPESPQDVLSAEFLNRIRGDEVPDHDSLGLISAAFAEVAADLAFRSMVTRPLVRKGTTVVLDSFGLKPVIKILLLGKFVAERDGHRDNVLRAANCINQTLAIYRECWAGAYGCYVEVEPEVALARKLAARAEAGILEDLTVIGEPGAPGFLRLQCEAAMLFKRFAVENDWLILSPTAGPQGAVTQAAAGEIVSYLAERKLLR